MLTERPAAGKGSKTTASLTTGLAVAACSVAQTPRPVKEMMMNTPHYVVKCRECDRVITQCRCADPNKAVRWSICNKCAERLAAEAVAEDDNDQRV